MLTHIAQSWSTIVTFQGLVHNNDVQLPLGQLHADRPLLKEAGGDQQQGDAKRVEKKKVNIIFNITQCGEKTKYHLVGV